MDPGECKNNKRNPEETCSAELNHHSCNRCLAFFVRLSYQVRIEKKQTPITVNNLKTVKTGVQTYQFKKLDSVAGPAKPKSRFLMTKIFLLMKIMVIES